MKLRQLRLTAAYITLGLAANCAYADNTITLSGLESGTVVHGLSAKSTHTTTSTVDDLLSSAARNNAMIMLSVANASDVERAKPIVEAAMNQKIDVLVEGTDDLLRQMKPEMRSVWVPGSRLFISTRSEELGDYLLTVDAAATIDQIAEALSRTRQQISARTAGNKTPTRATAPQSASARSSSSSGSFQMPQLISSTPSGVCISIRNQLAATLNDPAVPTTEVTNAVQRVCQYGTVGEFRAVTGEPAYGMPADTTLMLNLRKEWMLLLSEDKAQPEGSRAYVWLRTLGDDAGSGFTWATGVAGHAYTRKNGVEMYDIMNTSIHSGWGPIESRPTAWPNKTPTDMFLCEKNGAAVNMGTGVNNGITTSVYCPIQPRLLSVLPGNTYNDQVTIANSTAWSIGGAFTGSVGASETGPEGSLSLSLSGGYTNTNTAQETLSLVDTTTNADTLMYRSTNWKPDWEAMAHWIEAKDLKKDSFLWIDNATPLAKTLNPAWSIVWELPLAQNAGRTTQYTSVYDARHQWCQWDDKDYRCENSSMSINGEVWMDNSSLILSLPKSQ